MLQNLDDMPSTFRFDGKMVAPDFTTRCSRATC